MNADDTATEDGRPGPLRDTIGPTGSPTSPKSLAFNLDLSAATQALIEAAANRESQIAERARRLRDSALSTKTRIAIIGKSDRGKSTLLQALRAASSSLAEDVDAVDLDAANLDVWREANGELNFDVFVLVLTDIDCHLSREERDALAFIAALRCPHFVVVNKIDDSSAADIALLRRRLSQILRHTTNELERPWSLSASPALTACLAGRTPSSDAGDFLAFAAELEAVCLHTLPEELAAARTRQLADLASQLRDLIDVEIAILSCDRVKMFRSVAQFNDLAAATMQEISDTQTLYAEDLGVLTRRLIANLFGMSHLAPHRCIELLRSATEAMSIRTLRGELPTRIDHALRLEFEEFLRVEGPFVQDVWRQTIEGLRAQTEKCTNLLRARTNGLIGTALPPIFVSAPSEDCSLLDPLLGSSGIIKAPLLDGIQGPKYWALGPALARHRVFDRLLDVVTAQVEQEAAAATTRLENGIATRYWHTSFALVANLGDAVRLLLHGISRAEDLRKLGFSAREREVEADLEARTTAAAIAAQFNS